MPKQILVNTVAGLQPALNTIDAGGTILVTPGVYNLPFSLSNRAGTVFGVTPFSLRVMKPCTISAYGVIFLVDTVNIAYGALWAYQIEGLRIEGAKFIGTAPVTEGGQLTRPAILLQDCLLPVLVNVTAANFSQGINVYETSDCSLDGVVTDHTHMSGVMAYKSDYTDLNNCRIRDAGDGHLSLYIGNHTNVNNCLVQETRGVAGAQGITLELQTGSTINNSTVEGFYYGVDVKNGSADCSVLDNTLRGNKYSAAIRLGDPNNPQKPSANITVTRNRMDAPTYVDSKAGTGHVTTGNYAV